MLINFHQILSDPVIFDPISVIFDCKTGFTKETKGAVSLRNSTGRRFSGKFSKKGSKGKK